MVLSRIKDDSIAMMMGDEKNARTTTAEWYFMPTIYRMTEQ
jgi:hypothetical protein